VRTQPYGTIYTMLAAHELGRLGERLGLSAEARAVIDTIRSSPPARRVRSAAGKVSVRYPSRKMRVTIQAESHRVELAGLPPRSPSKSVRATVAAACSRRFYETSAGMSAFMANLMLRSRKDGGSRAAQNTRA
jgi:hypothetical protein